jgi:TetR/AcrR family transcriptional regulator
MSATRETILRRAIEAFAAHGFEGTSTANIARQCGVTQPLVHYHFASKENLWREAVDLLFSEVRAAFGQVPPEDADKSPRDVLRAFMRRFVHQCAHRPEIAQIVLREGTHRNPRFDWLVERHLSPLIAGVSELFTASLPRDTTTVMPPLHIVFVAMGGANLLFSAPAFFEALAGRSPTEASIVEAHADAMVAVLDRIMGPPVGFVEPAVRD